jgi:hypothetical protein
MTTTIDPHAWVYVAVQNPGNQETIIGQHDPENDIQFIPLFRDKNAAMQGILHLAKNRGQTMEIQAIIYEDLVKYAIQGGHLLFVLDGSGQILSKMAPDGRPL